MDESCTAEFGEITIECELPAGHEGDHKATIEWVRADPLVLAAGSVAIAGGYMEYLKQRYR